MGILVSKLPSERIVDASPNRQLTLKSWLQSKCHVDSLPHASRFRGVFLIALSILKSTMKSKKWIWQDWTIATRSSDPDLPVVPTDDESIDKPTPLLPHLFTIAESNRRSLHHENLDTLFVSMFNEVFRFVEE
jgi:hypothetical protein